MGEPEADKATPVPEPQPQPQPQTLELPTSFSVRDRKKDDDAQQDLDTRYTLRGDNGTSLLIVATDNALTLHSGLTKDAPRLGTIEHHADNTQAVVSLFLGASRLSPSAQLQMTYAALGDRRAAHVFSAHDDDYKDFQWRNEGSGWALQHAPNAAATTVLATGALSIGSKTGPEFALTAEGGEYSSDVHAMAAVTFLRVWDKVRRDLMPDVTDEDVAMAATGALCCALL